jgi:hypothetical protein
MREVEPRGAGHRGRCTLQHRKVSCVRSTSYCSVLVPAHADQRNSPYWRPRSNSALGAPCDGSGKNGQGLDVIRRKKEKEKENMERMCKTNALNMYTCFQGSMWQKRTKSNQKWGWWTSLSSSGPVLALPKYEYSYGAPFQCFVTVVHFFPPCGHSALRIVLKEGRSEKAPKRRC